MNLNNNKYFLLFLILLLPSVLFAIPDWIKDKTSLPKCPKSGVKVLSDDYPAMAHVFSDWGNGEENDILKSLTLSIINGSNKKRMPLLILHSVEKKRYDQAIISLRKELLSNHKFKKRIAF